MARETKAERLAREAAIREAMEAEQMESYPTRLMAMLERAVKQNFELIVRDAKFILEDRDDRADRVVELSLIYNQANQEALHELDWRLEIKEEAEQRALERARIRNSALSKLSQEEREILGV